MKRIGVIGSSGGNLRSQGGDDPRGIIAEVEAQAAAAGIEVAFVQFVLAATSMDGIAQDAAAKLYALDGDGRLAASDEQPLSAINERAAALDAQLADQIAAGQIDALMLMSCDPAGVNRRAIEAAVTAQIPVAGTGGTSMARVREMGANVVAVSGTTGTTPRTRAVSAISAFASAWGLSYTPALGKATHGFASVAAAPSGLRDMLRRVSIRGVMMASMPGFIAMAVSLALSHIPGLDSLSTVFDTLVGYLPVLVAAIAAKQVSGLDEVGIVAGMVAGVLSVDGGIIAGIATGVLAGLLAYYIGLFCIRLNVPGTTTNIAAGGIAGLASGLVGKFAIAPVALVIGGAINGAIDGALAFSPVAAGAIAGALIWFAIMGGVYHAAILPLIMLEMENAGFSFLGAIDLVCLVMVCAGIQLAYILRPRNHGDRTSAIANIIVNLGFGTFVEAAYPFMFSSKRVFAGTIVASTISGMLVGLFDVRCTAYVPCFVAPFLSNGKPVAVVVCVVAAILIACALTLLANAGKVSVGEEEASTVAWQPRVI